MSVPAATGERHMRAVVLAIACFMVISLNGMVLDKKVRTAGDAAEAVALVKQKLPAGTHLVSYGHVDALFAYHFGELIESKPVPLTQTDAPDRDAYFCVRGSTLTSLPFEWEQIGAVPIDRNRGLVPERVVVVGRRVDATAR